jgi:GNAT superfamily N-acetyltransferase
MRLPTKQELAINPLMRCYLDDVDDATFLGIYEGKQLVAVNSFHRVGGTSRSRGLYVEPEFRNRGYAYHLLRETWRQCVVKPLWSYPNATALPVYLKAGFRVVSESIYDPIEKKTNYYVVS